MSRVKFPADHDRFGCGMSAYDTFDRQLFSSFQEKEELPPCVEEAKKAAFEKVLSLAAQKEVIDMKNLKTTGHLEKASKKERKPTGLGKWRTALSAAAAAALFLGVCAANPAFASKIPLIGRVFEAIGNSYTYSGNFDDYITPIAGETDEDALSQTVNGMTVSLSETYVNNGYLYVSFVLETEEPFPETRADENTRPGVLCLGFFQSVLSADFCSGTIMLPGMSGIEARLMDDHTAAGILRVNLSQKDRNGEAWSDSMPDDFSVQMHISSIFGERDAGSQPRLPEDLYAAYQDGLTEAGISLEAGFGGRSASAYESLTEEQKEIENQLFSRMMADYYERYSLQDGSPDIYKYWSIEGPWDFTFDIHKNSEGVWSTVIDTRDILEVEELRVTKTPFEISVTFDRPYEPFRKNGIHFTGGDYVVVVFDEAGEYMGVAMPDVPIQDHPISTVTLYVCDWSEYMELKGYYWSPDYEEKAKEKTFQEYLAEHALYSTELAF